jgi:hypothetical protein
LALNTMYNCIKSPYITAVEYLGCCNIKSHTPDRIDPIPVPKSGIPLGHTILKCSKVKKGRHEITKNHHFCIIYLQPVAWY